MAERDKEKWEVVKGDRQRPLQSVFETEQYRSDPAALAATLPIVLTQ